jgi:protein-disulfide isomerase
VSRGYNARRKAKRRQARAFAKPKPPARRTWSRRLVALVPVLIIAATLAVVGILGFGTSDGISKQQVEQEVTTLLAGIPQQGVSLGSPRAPITVRVFADLECPTVKRFVVSYLPSIINAWVRSGSVRLEYRSLQTDTLNERTFFRQEVAALAAGGQDKMWNFILTFVHEQEPEYTGYATEDFLTDIASQVPGLDRPQWRHDREDALLSKPVAFSVHSAHARGLRHTPSFLLGVTSGKVDKSAPSGETASLEREVHTLLAQDRKALSEESPLDNPALRSELEERKEVRELREE